jgi:peptide/nickel transport system substrate-binding protein
VTSTRRPGTPTPIQGGIATIGVVGAPRDLNPAFDPRGLPGALFRPVVEGLFDTDAEGRPRPWLAESVPGPGQGIAADGRVVIVRLRQGVAWEDGRPFTSRDVLFTHQAGRNPNNPFPDDVAAAYRAIRTVDALDSYTVRLALDAPGTPYLRAFAPILPAHLFNDQTTLTDHPYGRAPFGTGPFRFAEWVPGDSLILGRSMSYRETDRPYLDAIAYRFFPDQTAADAALASDELDLLLTPDLATFVPAGKLMLRGVAPRRNAPPTWNAREWWRDKGK